MMPDMGYRKVPDMVGGWCHVYTSTNAMTELMEINTPIKREIPNPVAT